MEHAFEWKKEYSVHVKEIDDQHKKLMKIILKLYKAINGQKVEKEIGVILDELIKYASYHFTTEEKYFIEFDYKYTDEHIKEHQKFAKKMSELKEQYQKQEVKISFELIDYLEDWLIDHLMETDQKYVECFTKHGLK